LSDIAGLSTFDIPMLCLYLLGRLELGPQADAQQAAVLAQPKRLAILAYLAAAAGTYQRRDTLLALFWPELDEFAARRALRNTLYQLRLALGDGVFVSRGDDEIMVDGAVLACDIAALRDAVSAGRYDEAIDLYRGELLEGFHVTNVGEGFDRWLARERGSALALALRAFDARVAQHQQAGDAAAAAVCAVRATELAPFDEVWLRRAALALDAVGDRGGALRLCDAFVQRMAAELEARPSAETQGLIERLRSGALVNLPRAPQPDRAVAVTSAPAPLPPASRPAASSPSTDASPRAATPLSNDAPPRVTPSAAPPLSRRSAWRLPAVSAAAAVVVLAGLLAIRTRAHVAPPRRERVLITSFENRTGDATLDPVGDMEVDWLARGLVGWQRIDVLDPRALLARGRGPGGQPVDPGQLAHRVGASLVVTGSYYRSGDSLLFVAAVGDGNGRVVRTVGPIAASLARPVDAVEATRTRVLTALASIVDPRSREVWNAYAAPPPFEAYEPYVAGWGFFWRGQFARAESLFARAASRDTSFDAATVAVATASANLLHCAVVDSVVSALARRGRSLDPLDALGIRIAVARCHGRNDEMLRLSLERERLISAASPSQLSTANAALWANHPLDAVAILERIDPAVDLDWMPTADHLDYWASLTEADHMSGRHEAELAAVERSGLTRLGRFLYGGRALAGLRRSADALAALDSALLLPAEPGLSNGMAIFTDGRPEYTGSAAWVGLWIARELHVHGDSANGRTAATRTLAWLEALPRDDRTAPEMRLFEAEYLEQLGRLADATRIIERLLASDSSNIDYRGTLAGLAAGTGDTALAGRLDRWLAALPPERALWGSAFYRARVASLQGRPADAVALVREALARGAWPYWVHLDPALHRLERRPEYVALIAPRP
jgi:DNA-binding SARP family transcriptional activator/TolB-like protein